MSHNHPHKPSLASFKLSSNFNQLYSQKKSQAQQFIKDITDNRQSSQQKSKQKSLKKSSTTKNTSQSSLFKFNTQSQALVDQVPVQIIKKRSQSRLQSMHDDDHNKVKFKLLQNQTQKKQNILKQRKQLLKKYNIDINDVMSQQNTINNTLSRPVDTKIQEEDPQGTVKPSQLYTVNNKIANPFTTPTLFQTPLLPCFASQFHQNPEFLTSKTIKQGQGVWRIGKIKIKKNKAVLKIGQIQYDSQLINAQGKCVGIKQDFMYKLKNWNGIWVCQPKQQNF